MENLGEGEPLESLPLEEPLGSTSGHRGSAASDNLDRTLRSIGRGTAVMATATIAVVALQFFTRVIVVRNISSDQWGEFNLGLSLASLLALIAAFGIPTATARSMAYEQTLAARMALVRRALYLSLPIAVGSTLVVFAFAGQLAAPFHESGLTLVFQLFSVSIGLTMLSNVLVGIFQGLERAEPYALFIQIINPAIFLVLTAVFVFAGGGFPWVLAAYVLSWVGAFAGLVVYSYRRLPRLLARTSDSHFTGDASGRVSFAALSVTLFGVATLTYVTSYADTLFLGLYQSAEIVGQYSSAMNLTRLLLVGTGTVTFIYLPITSRLRRQQDYHGLRETYVTVTRWMALLTLPLTYVFFFDPALSLAFAFTPNQVGGATALSLLVLSNTIAILLGPCVPTLGGLGETHMVMWFTLASAITNILLCFLLIPPYGMIGAAIAWSVARLVFPTLSLARIYQEHQISPFRRTFVRPAALSTVILVPLFLFVLPKTSVLFLPILILLPFVVFGGAILATRSVDRGDLQFALAVEQRFGRVARPFRRLLESRLNPDAYLAPAPPAAP